MATKQASFVHVDEHYIHLELSSSSNFVSYPNGSPSQNREFEFQITSVSNEKGSLSSLADELFYKGKLLPLHLLNNSNAIAISESVKTQSALKDSSFPLPSSCPSISPSESCMAISEVNPDKFLFVWPSENNGFVGDLPKKSWSNKLKQIKQFWPSQKLKASKAYVQSLFSKSGCLDKSCATASNNAVAEKKSKTPVEIVGDKRHQIFMKTISREVIQDGVSKHRRSFSGSTGHSATKASSLMSMSPYGSRSSSFSLSSSSRSSCANSERESSIAEAIAHCKQSQQQCTSSSRKTPDDVRICSQFASDFVI